MIMLSDEIEKVEIDPEKLKRIKALVIQAERENLKTGAKRTPEMVLTIRKIFEDVLK